MNGMVSSKNNAAPSLNGIVRIVEMKVGQRHFDHSFPCVIAFFDISRGETKVLDGEDRYFGRARCFDWNEADGKDVKAVER